MERRAIIVQGIVQGVGFRPFVYNLASRLGLFGYVRNETGTLRIEIEGERPTLDDFLRTLVEQPPPLAKIEHIAWQSQDPRSDKLFRIETSTVIEASPVFISPDVATCEACLAEMLDPTERRHAYPFLNCTHCGPRLTIITGAPYDRHNTTMAAFPMCPKCREEYENPADRRFHAQPTACAACGPRLQLLGSGGEPVANAEPIAAFRAALREGRLGALKGLGGYHLACDARNESAVAELRRRKHRDEKPFALMVLDIAAARALGHISQAEEALLLSPRRPIVLLRTHPHHGIAEAVAPGNPYLGVMLPYTPLHHFLLREADGMPLVMTSGNRSDEPIAYEDDDALRRLAGIADLFLMHNRPIHVRCDDSVTRIVDGVELPMRRSRGYAPWPIDLPLECPVPILAVGGQLKATFALGRGRQAFLSHHLGDLDHYEAYRAFERDLELYQKLFALRPELVVHDAHPDYASTRFARAFAIRERIPVLEVQHHHAHMASAMAEHGLAGPVIGVTFDGTGYGTDSAIWGGEFLVGDFRSFRRVAHFRYVGMPGGDRAIAEPWRIAVSHLRDAGADFETFKARVLPAQLAAIDRMLERGFQTPMTSSAGRLFDAVAAIIGVRDRVSYEGQAAVELEWLAEKAPPSGVYPFEIDGNREGGQPSIVDSRPLIRALIRDKGRGLAMPLMARRFHSTLVEMIANVCSHVREDCGLNDVVLSGGVFLNALLTCEVVQRLGSEGFHVSRHRLVPPNDGGLSLGQLAIAAACHTSAKEPACASASPAK